MRKQVMALIGFCLVAGGVAGQGGKGDKALEGPTWSIVAFEKGGKKEDATGKGFTATFTGGKLHLSKGGGDTKDGTYKIDPTKKPKQIDMVVENETVKGIYEIKGDTLRICGTAKGDPRPTEFKTGADSPALILTFSREKKKADK